MFEVKLNTMENVIKNPMDTASIENKLVTFAAIWFDKFNETTPYMSQSGKTLYLGRAHMSSDYEGCYLDLWVNVNGIFGFMVNSMEDETTKVDTQTPKGALALWNALTILESDYWRFIANRDF